MSSKCETCLKESEKVETLTLCNSCFNKVSMNTEFLILENGFLKFILRNLIKPKEEKNEQRKI